MAQARMLCLLSATQFLSSLFADRVLGKAVRVLGPCRTFRASRQSAASRPPPDLTVSVLDRQGHKAYHTREVRVAPAEGLNVQMPPIRQRRERLKRVGATASALIDCYYRKRPE